MNSIDTFDNDLEAAKANVNDIRDELQVKEANKHTFKQFVDNSFQETPMCSQKSGILTKKRPKMYKRGMLYLYKLFDIEKIL